VVAMKREWKSESTRSLPGEETFRVSMCMRAKSEVLDDSTTTRNRTAPSGFRLLPEPC
jgi:hypothetical protein